MTFHGQSAGAAKRWRSKPQPEERVGPAAAEKLRLTARLGVHLGHDEEGRRIDLGRDRIGEGDQVEAVVGERNAGAAAVSRSRRGFARPGCRARGSRRRPSQAAAARPARRRSCPWCCGGSAARRAGDRSATCTARSAGAAESASSVSAPCGGCGSTTGGAITSSGNRVGRRIRRRCRASSSRSPRTMLISHPPGARADRSARARCRPADWRRPAPPRATGRWWR